MWRRAALLVAALAAVAGCASAISGSGHLAGPARPTFGLTTTLTIAPPGPSAPSGSSSVVPSPLTCPNVTYAAGRLAFACITAGLTPASRDPVWDLTLMQTVEPNWVLAEGAAKLAPLKGRSLEQVALALRSSMLKHQEYGTAPKVRTLSAKAATVAGVPAFVLQTEFTINATYRIQNSLQVKVERLWIVTLNAGDGQVAAWYTSVPDDVSNLWPKVATVIKSIGLV